MVGPIVKVDPESLPKRPNIAYLGGKPYAELPSYAAGFDICLMPFALNEASKFINPTKTLEYLASGRPVVATDLEPVRRVEGPVFRVEPGGDFVAGVRSALAAGPVEEAERRRTITANSWASRSAAVKALALQD
jgi:UDP-galactopyranose mutase